jgi:hypothetical protein
VIALLHQTFQTKGNIMPQLLHYQFQLSEVETGKSHHKSGKAFITTAGSPQLATIYDKDGTVLSNPLSFTGGNIDFYTASTVTSVDVIGQTEQGYNFIVPSANSGTTTHGIAIGNQHQTVVIPFSYDTQTTIGTSFDCGLEEIAGVLYHPCQGGIKVTAADATETLEFGNEDDADGYFNDISYGSTGVVAAHPYGTATAVGVFGQLVYTADRVDAASRVGVSGKSFTYNLSSGSDTGEGYIFLPSTLPIVPLS